MTTTISRLYSDQSTHSAFSTKQNFLLRTTAVAAKNKKDIQAPVTSKNSGETFKFCLEKQDAHTLHTHARKRFARNPCAVTKVKVVWEYYLLDVQVYSKCKDIYSYILSVIDVF